MNEEVKAMKILKVIHGYPPRYNAGSEVYTQTLVNGLQKAGHEVTVFAREEDPFRADFVMKMETCPLNAEIPLYLVNYPRSRDRYRHAALDRLFEEVLEKVQPDVVHFGHLNHLSTSIIQIAAVAGLPTVFTLHDYWLMCPRGQFMQTNLGELSFWQLCSGQDNRKCAVKCYSRYFSGSPEEEEHDLAYWTDWIRRRMTHVRQMTELVDLFIAPSRWLYRRFHQEFGIPEKSMVYLDYGFEMTRLSSRERDRGDEFVFGYIGTHIPAKGIQHLIPAFEKLKNIKTRLIIWGRDRLQNTVALKNMVGEYGDGPGDRIEWRPEYSNPEIIEKVFNHVDAIIVSSIWDENSPLVIHEAQQARVPVITANHGGMADYVQHEVNGLLFDHRNFEDLTQQMERLAGKPEWAVSLGKRGYLHSPTGDIPSVEEHVTATVELYKRVINEKGK
ncbi:MAG: glycosyltransferase [Promethearchaeota archaeon]